MQTSERKANMQLRAMLLILEHSLSSFKKKEGVSGPSLAKENIFLWPLRSH